MEQVSATYARLLQTTNTCVAAAVAAMRQLPEAVTPVVRALMAAVQTEPDATLQRVAAAAIARAIRVIAARPKTPNPSIKIAANICEYLSADTAAAPLLVAAGNMDAVGIFTLRQQKADEAAEEARKVADKTARKVLGALVDAAGDAAVTSDAKSRAAAISRRCVCVSSVL